jgi:ketosteroid isomerase-like protein
MRSEIDVIRGMYPTFGRGDVASVLAALAAQIVWIEAEGFPGGGILRAAAAEVRRKGGSNV